MIDALPYVMLIAFASLGVIEAAEGIQRWRKPKPPKRWKLQLTAPDGQPEQGYLLTQKQLKRVLALVQHELEHDDEPK